MVFTHLLFLHNAGLDLFGVVLHTSHFYILRVWIYLKSWELYGKDRSNHANLYEKIREINCKESASSLEQNSASFHIGRPHSPLSRGRVSL